MPSARAELKTGKASSYVQRLCKHFAHKVPVEYTATFGKVEFDQGLAEMSAKDGMLSLSIVAPTTQGMERCKAIVEDHLVRFAFRENVEGLDWHGEGEAE